MQITKINSFNNTYTNYRQQNSNNNLNFGFKLPKLQKDMFVNAETKNYIELFLSEISNNLSVNRQKLKKYVTPYQPERMAFFKGLADKITVDFFTHKIDIPKNAFEQIEEVYNSVPKPDKLHHSILKDSSYTFNETAQLLKLAQENKDNYNLIKQLREVKKADADIPVNFSAQNIIDIVISKGSGKLKENFDNYRSYIALHHNNPNFVETFIKELEKENSGISSLEFDTKLAIREVKNGSLLLRQLPDKFLEKNWNKEGFELLSQNDIPLDQLTNGEALTDKKALEFYENLIKSTTKDNMAERILVFKNFSGFATEGNTTEVLSEVLNRIDNDKNFKKLINAVAQNNDILTRKPLTELMYYTDTFGSDVLAKKADKFLQIINSNAGFKTKPEEVVQNISKNLNNKYYITPNGIDNLRQKEAMKRMTAFFFPDTKAELMRFRRKFKYEVMPKIFGTGNPVEIKQNIPYEDYVKSFAKPEIKPIPANNEVVSQPAVETAPKIKIKRDYKAQKLLIQKDAQEIIKSRMKSAKQIQEQIGDYTKKATKMRNQFLNEMFNSVAETRAQQRAQGIKRPNISNADVLDVYQKINGKNRKIFKYLLTKRTESGEREFNLKQISQILDDVKKNRPPKKNLNKAVLRRTASLNRGSRASLSKNSSLDCFSRQSAV